MHMSSLVGEHQQFSLLIHLVVHIINSSRLTAVYPGQPGCAGTKTLRNVNPIQHPHCPQIPHKHSEPSVPDLPLSVYLQGLILRRTRGNSWKKHEELEHTNTHFFNARLILDLLRPLVNRWSPLTHASHCMTTSRPAAATQTRVGVSPTIHPKVFLCQMSFLPQLWCSVHSLPGLYNIQQRFIEQCEVTANPEKPTDLSSDFCCRLLSFISTITIQYQSIQRLIAAILKVSLALIVVD